MLQITSVVRCRISSSSIMNQILPKTSRNYLAEARSSQRKAQKMFWFKTKMKKIDLTLRPLRALRETPLVPV